MISFDRVSHVYNRRLGRAVRAVDDLSLEIAPGEVLGLAGPNGAGKSTLIAMLLGYLAPMRGDVRIGGEPPRRYIERYGIGYLSELVAIEPRWRARESLIRYATLAGIDAPELHGRVDAALERLGLEEHADKRVRALSKGTLQRLGLAQALLRDERVLVLDEPTHGLDPVWTHRFRDIVDALRSPDRAILVASHNLDELQRIADRVAIIDRGRLQRIVETRGALRGSGSGSGTGRGRGRGTAHGYRLVMVAGSEHVPGVFPEAVPKGGGEWEVPTLAIEALNLGIARLVALGGRLSELRPTQSTLEEEFREAIGESAAQARAIGRGAEES